MSKNEELIDQCKKVNYTKQAKAATKTHLDGVKMNEDLIFDTLEKLKSKKSYNVILIALHFILAK